MAIETRLTQRLGIKHPILSAPMAFAAGGRLAAAVTNAGGMGFIGGGYGDSDWLDAQFREAGNSRVGCGFISWSLAKQPDLLERALERKPVALLLSFGDPEPFAAKIKTAGALLICQVQTRRDGERAIEIGADVIVAQGAEAGGHGERRATMTLVPEIADLIATRAPETLLCAAGGIADGRGLAAALMLGADGVLVGSRFWASEEALVHPNMHAAAVIATGDDTVRTTVTDMARSLDWPARYNIRVVRNSYTDQWHGREQALASVLPQEAGRYLQASATGDAAVGGIIAGEAVGMISTIEPAARLVERMVTKAEALLGGGWRRVG